MRCNGDKLVRFICFSQYILELILFMCKLGKKGCRLDVEPAFVRRTKTHIVKYISDLRKGFGKG